MGATVDYRAYARQAAQQNGLDPDIFERQIDQESGFNPSARSPAGAQGIAQIMPQYHPGVNPWDPGASLDYAAQLMGGYLQQYNGDYGRALAAYNAGPGAVAQYGGVPPYAETQRYVHDILQGGTGSVANPNATDPTGVYHTDTSGLQQILQWILSQGTPGSAASVPSGDVSGYAPYTGPGYDPPPTNAPNGPAFGGSGDMLGAASRGALQAIITYLTGGGSPDVARAAIAAASTGGRTAQASSNQGPPTAPGYVEPDQAGVYGMGAGGLMPGGAPGGGGGAPDTFTGMRSTNPSDPNAPLGYYQNGQLTAVMTVNGLAPVNPDPMQSPQVLAALIAAASRPPGPIDTRGYGSNLDLGGQMALAGQNNAAQSALQQQINAAKLQQVNLENQSAAAVAQIQADGNLSVAEKNVQIAQVNADATIKAHQIDSTLALMGHNVDAESAAQVEQMRSDLGKFTADVNARATNNQTAGALFGHLLDLQSTQMTSRQNAAISFFNTLASLAPQQNLVNAYFTLRGQAPPPSIAQTAMPQLGAILGVSPDQQGAITNASGIGNVTMAPFLQQLLGVQATPTGGAPTAPAAPAQPTGVYA